MSLTYQQIWDRYSHVSFRRRIYIKRLHSDGTYESSFTEVPQSLVSSDSLQSLSRSLPNNSWQFGKILIPNANLKILSPYQQFASEQDPNSLFAGYIRNKSIIKITDALIDNYTDPETPTEISVTTFQGLLDSTTATTQQGYETITALDLITALKNINVKELTLVQTTMNNLIYEIINRPEFTKFFNVSNSTDYINAGYNATSIDVSVYEGTVLEMLEDLAKGHSIFYVDPDDNYFYFKSATPTAAVQYSFLEKNNRKIRISKYKEGIDRQITHWYWENSNVSSIKSGIVINPINQTFNISGITNATQRQNTLNVVLLKTENPLPYFELEVPFFPIVKVLDRVVVQSFGQAPANTARWGMFLFTDNKTTSPEAAPRWRKAAGIRISADDNWMVRAIKHTSKLTTILELVKIV